MRTARSALNHRGQVLWFSPAVLLACLLLGACTALPLPGPATVPAAPAPSPVPAAPTVLLEHSPGGGAAAQPLFVLRYENVELRLSAYTYCTHGPALSKCVDGFDDHPPSIGSVGELFVYVPTASLDHLDVGLSVPGGSGDATAVPVTALGSNWWRLRPHAAAGTYRLSIFASGDGAGDMAADVLWTSTAG